MDIAIYHDLPSGGAKRSLYEAVRLLSRSHNVHLYSLSTAAEEFCDVRPFVERWTVYEYRPGALFGRPFGRMNQVQRWRDLNRLDDLSREIATDIDREGYDVVLAEPCMWTQAPLVLRHLETPAIYYCQEPPRGLYDSAVSGYPNATGWRAVLDRIDPAIAMYRSTLRRLDWEAVRSARVVLVNSRFMRDAIAAIYGIEPKVAYLGVDPTLWRPLLGVERGRYVLSVGAIQPHKGFRFLVESLATIRIDHRPPLLLVGNAVDPAERQAIEALATRLGVALRIETLLDEPLLVRRYCEAALVAYAPYNEPLGLVPLEAMACGTPVVGVLEGGLPETLLDGVTGLLVERDASTFGAAIEHLFREPARQRRFGTNGREHVLAHWTWESSVAAVEQELHLASSINVSPQSPSETVPL
jgi:glycosyltransferase involved in cell wall biosynthesis